MDVRLRAALASDDLNVAAWCREHGTSRDRFYFWRNRYRSEGLEGLEPRSRAPKTNPHRISAELEDAIVALRKELTDLGVDAGAATIQWHLGQRRRGKVPSESTIWRTLVRRGFVVPEPKKRPKASFCRFEATAPNELWQADCIDWTIATGVVRVLSFLDDHSRIALRVKALPEATSEATWATFCEATQAWGRAPRPAQRQRPQLLGTPPRGRGPLRAGAPSDRGGPQDQPPLPPPDLRQGL